MRWIDNLSHIPLSIKFFYLLFFSLSVCSLQIYNMKGKPFGLRPTYDDLATYCTLLKPRKQTIGHRNRIQYIIYLFNRELGKKKLRKMSHFSCLFFVFSAFLALGLASIWTEVNAGWMVETEEEAICILCRVRELKGPLLAHPPPGHGLTQGAFVSFLQ